MKTTEKIKCKQCKKSLRLWPKMGAEFYCDNNYSCEASQGNAIVNTGINRYNCFRCDLDYCLSCKEEMEKHTDEKKEDDDNDFDHEDYFKDRSDEVNERKQLFTYTPSTGSVFTKTTSTNLICLTNS